MEAVHYNTGAWVQENEKSFLPPVCNKMMHNDQLKVFYVGGGNQRKDFHMEEGEELFYMRKGDMHLPILVHGKFRTVHIKEGQVFLLPGRIPHSPQRPQADSVGLVIERERLEEEKDGLRYFVGSTTDILWERWFYCSDLGSQLGPIIREYFASTEHMTGCPVPGSGNVLENPPWEPRADRIVEEPFYLQEWIDKHREAVRKNGQVGLFQPRCYQSDVYMLGRGKGRRCMGSRAETFLMQLEGTAEVKVDDKQFHMKQDDCLRVPVGQEFEFSPSEDCITLSTSMDPMNKSRPENNEKAFLKNKGFYQSLTD